ncbi:nitroreductase family protein [Paraglaciecola arctica]|uniref:nitroreductase family protein n=1 Tax=Paraglaciecola arctica TaxID=1128911 RepID=UPI001C07ADF0|nr:nitroreductase family protein [Paraglaciecola arctica]MBU3004339.1 nitroreductase family protein [Paraglaciecola arctica]
MKLKQVIPKAASKHLVKIKNHLVLINHALYDLGRFIKYSSINAYNEDAIITWLMQDSHRIEKGLSLRNPKKGFGKDVLVRIFKNIQLAKNFDKNLMSESVDYAIFALDLYFDYHKDSLDLIAPKLVEAFQSLENKKNAISSNSEHVSKDINEYFGDYKFDDLCFDRASVRQFDLSKNISKEELEALIKPVIKTPSVCNRQHCKVKIITERNLVLDLLKLQNGNRGFTEDIPALAIVTSDISFFVKPEERNQAFVDGGMFAMSLLYSMQNKGFVACPLNWSANIKNDKALYKFNILENKESVIMFIAFGRPLNTILFAKSPRKSLNNFYQYYK